MAKSSKAKGVVLGILIALFVFEAFDFLGGYDYIKAMQYQPSAEMETVINNLDLTDRGERILKAANPNLDSRDTFNKKCNSHTVEIYVLGCYLTGDDAIHLYDVDTEELDGVKESTTAHELLHAVYNRLPFWEKSSLNNQLKMVFDSLDENSEIKTSMKLYNDDDFYDELHSRLGTEIKDLPSELEKHYAAIFNDQDAIVDYYEKYSGTFKTLENELKTIEGKLENLKKEIDEEETRLKNTAVDLNIRIDDYNSRVSAGNYSSVSAAKTEGNKLQVEVDKLNSDYDELSKKIAEYNKLIGEYNNSVIRTNQIFDSINSNSEIIETVNN